MIIPLFYIVLCFIIATIGANRKFGYWGYFFCSLFFTPFIGAIILLGSDRRSKPLIKCPNCGFSFLDTKAR